MVGGDLCVKIFAVSLVVACVIPTTLSVSLTSFRDDFVVYPHLICLSKRHSAMIAFSRANSIFTLRKSEQGKCSLR